MMSSTPSQFDQTVQMASPVVPSDSAPHPAIALVEGTHPGLSQETQQLLAHRLRIASLLLFAGFLVFFVRNLFYLDTFLTLADWMLFWDHLAIILVTGVVGLRLCTDCHHTRKHLRIVELLVFGGSATFFLFLSYTLLNTCAVAGFLPPMVPPWLLLVFTYALFIPNTWQRAAAVIGTIATIPIALIVLMRLTSEQFVQIVSTNPHFTGYETSVVLLMGFSAVTATWGVRTIGQLRRSAYEARRIGQYRLKRLLGSGGMGEVHLAEHVLLKRPCAIKLIRPEKAGDPQALARFEREVQATARLTHWNTIEIFDYSRAEDGTFYYVMEYLPGMNLEQLVDMYGPLPPARVIHLLSQTCDALSEAPAQQFIHRDIKPANIFAARRGHVDDVAKLLDFGLVKPLARMETGNLTQEGTIAGSPLYMSPEQITGEAADERSDIYSLGVVAYFLLTGKRLFEDDNAMKVLIAHAHETPPRPSKLAPGLSPELDALVMRCLEKSADDRFPNVEALRSALLRCEESGGWTRKDARLWWASNGCPHKKELDEEVFEQRALAIPDV